MPSIYFHIPFCKQACHYCDFHFSTSLTYKEEMIQSLFKEIEIRKNYLGRKEITSIYFGGGTPSILEADDIARLIAAVAQHFEIQPQAEITLEANPDDLHAQKVKALRNTEINRFSIGIQSFFEEDLVWMNRAHNASEADAAIKRVQDAGFENITADLIYGYPLLTDDKWKSNIQKMLDTQIPHISAYSMTVEPQTALDHFIKKGKTPKMNEDQSAAQFEILVENLLLAGFEHYEISNFAQPGMHAQHNSSYWKGDHYLGIGPSAHSFDGESRTWNIANNAKYMQGIREGSPMQEKEDLSLENRINEYIMTTLRTKWGMDLNHIEKEFDYTIRKKVSQDLQPFLQSQEIEIQDDIVRLTAKGKLMADHIASELFIVL